MPLWGAFACHARVVDTRLLDSGRGWKNSHGLGKDLMISRLFFVWDAAVGAMISAEAGANKPKMEKPRGNPSGVHWTQVNVISY